MSATRERRLVPGPSADLEAERLEPARRQRRRLLVMLAAGAGLLLCWFALWDLLSAWFLAGASTSMGTLHALRGAGAALLAGTYAALAVRQTLRGYTRALEEAVERRTAQLRAAMELSAAQERRFREVIESASDGFILLDPRGNISYFNSAAERLFGYRRAEVIGRPCSVLIEDSKCAALVEAQIRGESRPGGLGAIHVIEGKKKDGSPFAADCLIEAPRVDDEVAFTAVVRDIGERRRAEEERRKHAEAFRTLIEQSPDGIIVASRDDLRLVYLNPAVVAFLGYGSAGDLIGRPSLDIIHPDDQGAVGERVARLRAGSARLPAVERRYRLRDGGTGIAEVVSLALDFEGRPCVMSFLRDVSERKRLESRLLAADRMASVGLLAAGVTHEINNPLAFVSANVNFAVEAIAEHDRLEGPAAKEVVEALRESQGGIERMRVIVRDIKTFAHTDESAPGPVRIERVLDTAGRMAANEIRHRARLVKAYAEEPLWVIGSEPKLNQVFLNLLANAGQAIAPGDAGRNEVRVSTRPGDGGRVVIEVADTGPGIPPEARAHLFEPFYTTKPPGVGTGLGLAICRDIVRAMGGEIEVESAAGKGATFRVLLPRAEAERAPGASPRAGAPEVAARRGRLLVIDDEPLLRSAVARILGPEHEVLLADSARAAMERISAGARFDLILCDVMMPEGGGLAFFEELRRIAPEQASRVVFMTGGVFTEDERELLQGLANPKLEKPLDSVWLRAFVRERLAALPS